MTESIRTTRNDERNAAFYGITDALADDGFAAAAQIEKMLEGLATAESWESMAARSASQSRQRELVPGGDQDPTPGALVRPRRHVRVVRAARPAWAPKQSSSNGSG